MVRFVSNPQKGKKKYEFELPFEASVGARRRGAGGIRFRPAQAIPHPPAVRTETWLPTNPTILHQGAFPGSGRPFYDVSRSETAQDSRNELRQI